MCGGSVTKLQQETMQRAEDPLNTWEANASVYPRPVKVMVGRLHGRNIGPLRERLLKNRTNNHGEIASAHPSWGVWHFLMPTCTKDFFIKCHNIKTLVFIYLICLQRFGVQSRKVTFLAKKMHNNKAFMKIQNKKSSTKNKPFIIAELG